MFSNINGYACLVSAFTNYPITVDNTGNIYRKAPLSGLRWAARSNIRGTSIATIPLNDNHEHQKLLNHNQTQKFSIARRR